MPGGRESLTYTETKETPSRTAGQLLYSLRPGGSACPRWTQNAGPRKYTGRGVHVMTPTKNNPRYANGNLRRKHRARLRAMGCECGICHGRFGPIHYDEPSDAAHPLSFVVDEIKPVAKWKQFGYPSARAAAEDWDNLQAAHYFCNAQKRDKTASFSLDFGAKMTKIPKVTDGSW